MSKNKTIPEDDSSDESTGGAPQSIAQPEPDSSDSLASLTGDLIESMPDVQEHAVAAHFEEQNAILAENASARDKRGDLFDPEQHAAESDGSPKLTANGYFAKKRGRKNGSTLGVESKPTVDQLGAQKQIKQRHAGLAAANAIIMLGVVVGGDEFKPIKSAEHGIDEKQNLENAFGDYFVAKDMDDIPAGVALSIALIGYLAPRFTMPKTQKRASGFINWVKVKIANRKLKKHGMQVKAEKSKDEILEA